jgi:hypothetical protein
VSPCTIRAEAFQQRSPVYQKLDIPGRFSWILFWAVRLGNADLRTWLPAKDEQSQTERYDSFRLRLDLVSALGAALGSAGFAVEVSADFDSVEPPSDFVSDDLDSDLLSDLDSVAFFESEAADFLYDSLR